MFDFKLYLIPREQCTELSIINRLLHLIRNWSSFTRFWNEKKQDFFFLSTLCIEVLVQIYCTICHFDCYQIQKSVHPVFFIRNNVKQKPVMFLIFLKFLMVFVSQKQKNHGFLFLKKRKFFKGCFLFSSNFCNYF